METTPGTQGLKTLQATEEEKEQKPKENMIASAGLAQFTQKEAVEWLKVEEQNALDIARASDEMGMRGAHSAHIRAEACSKLQAKISKAKGSKIWDLNAELGAIQDRILGKEAAQSVEGALAFQGIGEL